MTKKELQEIMAIVRPAIIAVFGRQSFRVRKYRDRLACQGKPLKDVVLEVDGYVYDKDGITGEKIDFLLELRASGNNRAEDYVKKFPTAEFHAGKRPWEVKCDVAIPAATQNELHLEDAKNLVDNGVS